MARIDAETGRFFESPSLDLAQGVEDALLTLLGTRRHRPNYGSYITDWGRDSEAVISSVYDALAVVVGVQSVQIAHETERLRIIINGARILPGQEPRRVLELTWGPDGLTWGDEVLQYG